MTLSSATTPEESGLGSNDNEEVLHIPHISKALTSDDLMSYPGHSLGWENKFLLYGLSYM